MKLKVNESLIRPHFKLVIMKMINVREMGCEQKLLIMLQFKETRTKQYRILAIFV